MPTLHTPIPPALLEQIEALVATGAVPRTAGLHLHIGHDPWCGHFRAQRCSCTPEFTLTVHPPDHPPYEVPL
jgi:hypothetical protein